MKRLDLDSMAHRRLRAELLEFTARAARADWRPAPETAFLSRSRGVRALLEEHARREDAREVLEDRTRACVVARVRANSSFEVLETLTTLARKRRSDLEWVRTCGLASAGAAVGSR